MRTRRTRAHFATCHLCEKKKTVWWEQRGTVNPEWIRVCGDCQHTLHPNRKRHPKDSRQLDLFAREHAK